jgi:hypothetical protein
MRLSMVSSRFSEFLGAFSRWTLLLVGVVVWAGSGNGLHAQNARDTVFTIVRFGRTMQATVVNGDTVPWAVLDEVMVGDKPVFTSAEARKKYYQLKRKVIKVYPYAVMAGNKLDSLNMKLDGLNNNRQRNKAIKEYQDFLEKRFEPELRKLTRSEGQVLAKLIQRETGMTVFHLIRQYRNTLTAWTWAATGAWYDISIREKYDPATNEDDRLVEAILRRAFAEGALTPRKRFYQGKTGKKR